MAKVNPQILSNTSPGTPLRTRRAANSVTWKVSEIGYFSSGLVTPVSGATGGDGSAFVQFAATQTASTSSSDVPVRVLESGDRLAIYVTDDGTDAALTNANIGSKYALYTASNITMLDVNVTGAFRVEELGSVAEPEEWGDAAPAKCIVVFEP